MELDQQVEIELRLGNTHFVQGELDAAATHYQCVIQLQPDHPEVHYYLGLVYRRQGKPHEAVNSYQRALQQSPDRADILLALGNAFLDLQRYDDAVANYQRSLQLNPNQAEAYNSLGGLYAAQNKLAQAAENFRTAITLAPNYAEAHANLGAILYRQEQLAEAFRCCQQALKINPHNASAYCTFGLVLAKQKKLDAAITYYQQAIALKPDYAEAYCNLGVVLVQKEQLEDAIAHYRQAIALNPNLAEAHYNLGETFSLKKEFVAAIGHYQQAIQIRPEYADAYCGLALAHTQQQNPHQAVPYYQQAISLQPDCVNAHFGSSMALLAMGDYLHGFEEYEWRWQRPEVPAPNFSQLQWDGSNLQGQTILIWAEQGFGDALQFIRFVPLVVERGGNVIVRCRSPLVRLFSNMPSIAQVIAENSPLPEFALHAPLMSLPWILKITLETLPNQVPYLKSYQLSSVSGQLEEEKAESRKLIADRSTSLKIGIVWASGYTLGVEDSRRLYQAKSIPLDLFEECLSIPNCKFYSLQVGEETQDIQRFNFGDKVEDWSDRIHDFADTAALIDELDLVISVDTAVAHLAGAMGKPVWVLLPYAPDWRWMLEREDSPWYPTMCLFRQQKWGEWEEVLARVVTRLNENYESISSSL